MSTRSTRALVLALALVVLTAGTGTASAASPAPPAAAPVTVTDANGNPVVISDASRVVSLGGAVTEVVYALGAQDQAGRRRCVQLISTRGARRQDQGRLLPRPDRRTRAGREPHARHRHHRRRPGRRHRPDPRVRRHHAHPSRREHRRRCEGEDPGHRAGARACFRGRGPGQLARVGRRRRQRAGGHRDQHTQGDVRPAGWPRTRARGGLGHGGADHDRAGGWQRTRSRAIRTMRR